MQPLGQANWRDRFLAEFNKAGKHPIEFPRYPYIDEYPTFISWPIVWVLAKTSSVGPELIALSGLLARLALAYLIATGLRENETTILFFLAYAIVSDCADGQMARYRKCVSSLGALYDLTSDFVGSIAIFSALSWLLMQETVLGRVSYFLGAWALVSYFCACTVWSYVLFRARYSYSSDVSARERFLSLPDNDQKTAHHYQLKYRFLRAVFNQSWLVSARFVLALPIWKDEVRAPRLLHVHSLASLNIHWMLLFLLIAIEYPVSYFLYYEIVFLPVLLLWVYFSEVKSPQ